MEREVKAGMRSEATILSVDYDVRRCDEASQSRGRFEKA